MYESIVTEKNYRGGLGKNKEQNKKGEGILNEISRQNLQISPINEDDSQKDVRNYSNREGL